MRCGSGPVGKSVREVDGSLASALLSLRLVFVDHIHVPCKLKHLVFIDVLNIVVANPADLNM